MQAHRRVPASRFVNRTCPDDQVADSPDHCVQVASSEPEVFGPVAWAYIHTVAENYTPAPGPDVVQKCAAWIDSTPVMLPCRSCESHMQKWVDEHDSQNACASRDNLRSYFVDLHNHVNHSTGGDAPWTDEQAKARYEKTELCLD
jgi:hypothetical protein